MLIQVAMLLLPGEPIFAPPQLLALKILPSRQDLKEYLFLLQPYQEQRDLFLSKIEPEGTLHELVFKVSISEEITSSPFSFIEVKKAAGFGKSVKAAIFVKKLLDLYLLLLLHT